MRLINRLNNNYAVSPQPDYALEFNGTDEYLQIGLPNNIASGTTNDWVSAGSKPAGWTEGAGTYTWNDTSQIGMTSTYAVKVVNGGPSSFIQIPGLTIGKKYKLKVRAKSTFGITYNETSGAPSTLMSASSEWNTVTKVFTATNTSLYFNIGSGTAYIDVISIKEDQGFDLNKDQEMILHSKNWDFEGSTTDWAGTGNHSVSLSTLDKSSGTQSLLASASGAGRGVELLSDPNFNDTAQWDKLNATVTGGKGIIDNQGGTLSDGYLISQDYTLTVGKRYEVEINIDSLTLGSSISLRFYDSASGNFTVTSIASSGRFRTQFTCTVPSCRIACRVSPTGSTGVNYSVYAIVDSMSFKEVLGEITLPTANIEPLVAGKKYTLQGEARSDTASRTITARIGTKEVTSTTLSTTAGTFTKFVLNFEATSGEVNQDLKLWLSGAGSVYVDKLSLTQAYDMIRLHEFKSNTDNAGKGIMCLNESLYFEIRAAGATRNQFSDDVSGADNRLTTYTKDVWVNYISFINRTDKLYGIKNGTSDAGVVCTSVGKLFNTTSPLTIGANNVGTERFNGQISHLQIIRFENISQSTFNSAITGLQYPTGGGAEEVLRVTFQDGSSIVNCLKDYSPKGHTVSGVLVDITNRKRVTR